MLGSVASWSHTSHVISRVPGWLARCRCVACLFPHLYPPYLHVLRVDPSRLDKVDLDALWGPSSDAAAAAASEAVAEAAQRATERGRAQGGAQKESQRGEVGREAGGEQAGVLSRQLARLEEEQHHMAEQVAELKSILLRRSQ
jgi:hypothetical protein